MKKNYLFSVLVLVLFSFVNNANAEMYTQSLSIGGDSSDKNQFTSSQNFTYSQLPSSNVQKASVQENVPQNVTINNEYYYPAVYPAVYPAYGRTYINTVPYYSRVYPTYSGYMNHGGINVGYNTGVNYNTGYKASGYSFTGGYDFGGHSRNSYNYTPPPPPPQPHPHNGGIMPPPPPPHRNLPPARTRLDW